MVWELYLSYDLRSGGMRRALGTQPTLRRPMFNAEREGITHRLLYFLLQQVIPFFAQLPCLEWGRKSSRGRNITIPDGKRRIEENNSFSSVRHVPSGFDL